jgi:uroporphyrin-III C-methyltransferase
VRSRPLVSFVGAGPGDPELVTLKALRRLREADVIVHDRLIPTGVLAEARAGAEIIDAGKAPGRHCMGQAEINWLLVDRARRRGHVVRLKGGDPTVFGRLAEEIDAVRAAGVEFEIVPGVTAATAAAARTGISLTARGRASMLVFATGTDHAGRGALSLDWTVLAQTDATLVFYMPVNGLAAITTALTATGRDRREPAIVVERAGAADERVLAARLGDIAERACAAGVTSPALLIIGPTVGAASVPAAVRHLAAAHA